MSATVSWDKGGSAAISSISNDAVRLVSSTPAPPGSRIEGTVAAEGAVPAGRIRVKIHSSKLQADGTFVLDGRPLDLSRELRERLAPPVDP